jgi:hypothetical protein
LPAFGSVTACAGRETAFGSGLGWVIGWTVSGSALPCTSRSPLRKIVSRPGTIGWLNVTRTADSESATTSIARSLPVPP